MNRAEYEGYQGDCPSQEGRVYYAVSRGATNSLDASLVTGLPRKTCSAHLSRLADAGVISVTARSKSMTYSSEQGVPYAPPLPVKELERPVQSLEDFLKRPRYGGAWVATRKRWSQEDDVWLKKLCVGNADLNKSADALGRAPSTLAHRAAGRGLKLPKEWAALIRPKRERIIRATQIQLAYPFIIKARGDAADLLEVNSLVPDYLLGREDVCQEIMLALYEGTVTIDELRKNKGHLRAFIRSFKRDNLEEGGYAISLDQPMRDGRSWHDVLTYETGDA
jgi:hypothetical protein